MSEVLAPRAGWQAGARGQRSQIALVQHASGLEPATNRGLLAPLTPAGADLVVLPEAFAGDFGPRLGRRALRRPLDGPFATRLAELAAQHQLTVVAGMFERPRTPAGPTTRWSRWGPTGSGGYRKIHLYDSFGHRESDRLLPGPLEPALLDIDGFRVGLMTCYDLRFPELARALVDRGRRGARGARGLGRRPAQGGPLAHAGRSRVRSRTRCTWPRPVSPVRATPATPWWSRPRATCSSSSTRTNRGRPRRPCPTRWLEETRVANPSLANRRM